MAGGWVARGAGAGGGRAGRGRGEGRGRKGRGGGDVRPIDGWLASLLLFGVIPGV